MSAGWKMVGGCSERYKKTSLVSQGSKGSPGLLVGRASRNAAGDYRYLG